MGILYYKHRLYRSWSLFKNLSNPIELIGLPVAGSASLVYKYANAQQATIRGIELDYRKELLWWLRVEANVFFIKSRVDVIDSKIYGLISTGQVDPLSTYAAYFRLLSIDLYKVNQTL